MFGRVFVWGREESIEEQTRVPAELDTVHHADDGVVLQDIDIAQVDGGVLDGGYHFDIGAVFPACDERAREAHGTPTGGDAEVCLGIDRVGDVHDEACKMRDAVDEVRWDGPGATFFGREHDVGKGFEFVEDDGAHAAVLFGVVDKVASEKAVGHIMRESVGDAFFGEALQGLDTALDQMSGGDPRCEPLSCVTIVDVSAGEWFLGGPIRKTIVPMKTDGSRVVICSGSEDPDKLRHFRVLICNEAFENFQSDDVHLDLFAIWIELSVKILPKGVCDICVDRLDSGQHSQRLSILL